MLESKSEKRELVVGALGNMLAWYNFALFMPFLPIISKQFFPIQDATLCSIISFLALSVGLFMRPIGAAVFGPIGDLIGRKKAIVLSILLMAIPTICIGFLPGYALIGVAAPILLLICRAFQGMSLGGEYTAAMVHLVESASVNRRGFFGSWADAGSQVGVLFAAQSMLFLHYFFSESEIYDFAWRIPFFFAAMLIPFAFRSSEKKKKDDDVEKDAEIKIIKVLVENKKAVLCTTAITSFSAVAFYTLLTFLPYYLVREGVLSLKESATCCVHANIAIILSTIGCGYLSDHFKRKPFIIGGILGVATILYIMFLLKISSLSTWIITYSAYGFFLGMYFSCRSAFFAESFPKKIRCTGVSFSVSIAQGVVGGSTPVIMNYCTSISAAMAILPISIVTIMAISAILSLEDRSGKELL